MRIGVRKGTVVALLAPNGADWVCWWVACARIGAIVVPINTLATSTELQRILEHSGAHVLVAVPEFGGNHYREQLGRIIGLSRADRDQLWPRLPQLRRVLWADEMTSGHLDTNDSDVAAAVESAGADVGPSDVLTIVYSSGSTGEPKGIVHTHGAVLRQAQRFTRLTATDSSTVLWTAMPLNWVGGLVWSWLRVAVAGGTFVTQAKFEPDAALRFLCVARVDTVTAWLTMIERMRSAPGFSESEHGHIRGLGRDVVGAPDRPTSLGMSETLGPHSGWFGASDVPPPDGSIGSWGRALPGIEHRIVDPESGMPLADGLIGELHVRGDSLMLGLHRRERSEVFTDDGWYPTGDRAELRDGWLFFHGRLDQVIKTAGVNVSPVEVQFVLESHPDVKQAWVMGIDDATRGQIVAAAIVADSADLDVQAVLDAARAHLAAYKMPRKVRVIEDPEIPWLSSQKVDIRRLRDMLGE
jgi:acyl-CoA synthetase (AMP-forming)/AMP-acid ligase II